MAMRRASEKVEFGMDCSLMHGFSLETKGGVILVQAEKSTGKRYTKSNGEHRRCVIWRAR